MGLVSTNLETKPWLGFWVHVLESSLFSPQHPISAMSLRHGLWLRANYLPPTHLPTRQQGPLARSSFEDRTRRGSGPAQPCSPPNPTPILECSGEEGVAAKRKEFLSQGP